MVLVVAIALIRAPYTRIPDALFVSDGFGYYVYLPSIVIDHDLDLSNQITRIPYEGEKRFFQESDQTGRRTNQFPSGSALVWLPFFLVADLAVVGVKAIGVSVERDGFGYLYELPVYLGSFTFGLAGVYLMLRTLKDLFGPPIAWASTFGVLFATPLAYYCWVEPNMSHSVAMFTIAWWVWLLCRAYRALDTRWSTWVVLGIVLGLVTLVRPYNGILGLVAIPVAMRISPLRGFRGSLVPPTLSAIARLGVCCLVAIVTWLPQSIVWKILYGDWLVVPRGSGYESMAYRGASVASYLSTVIVYSPLLGIAVAGLMAGRFGRWNSMPTIATEKVTHESSRVADAASNRGFAQAVAPMMLFVLFLISVIVVASRDWYLGTAFGQRRMVDWSVFFGVGLGVLLTRLRHRTDWYPSAEWCILILSAVHCAMAAVYLSHRGVLPEYGIVF
jgi:hypothetical protein